MNSARDATGRDALAAPVHHPCMPDLPASFRAYVVDKPEGGAFSRGLRTLAPADLPPGEVTVRVEWSSVNFKDGLAAREDGRVARAYPLIPGIDLAGTVVASDDDAFPVGTKVLANGYDIGVGAPRRLRGAGADPVRLGRAAAGGPDRARRDGDRHGRVHRGDERPGPGGARPAARRRAGPRHGGVRRRGLHGRRHPRRTRPRGLGGHRQGRRGGRLPDLGAAGILTRDEVTAPGRPLDCARWAGAVDTVGAATLPYVLRTLRIGAAVASSGNASGAELVTTVFPFILRGVALLGMDSANMAIGPRRALWDRLATDLRPRGIDDGITEVDLDTLEPALDAIVAGEARGRWVVRVAVGALLRAAGARLATVSIRHVWRGARGLFCADQRVDPLARGSSFDSHRCHG